jgi:3-hydroxyacyl-CoA dehydrogenase
MPAIRPFHIRKAAVLGAGVMGAQIAAHLVNANVETLLFELTAAGSDPNAAARKAIEDLKRLEPAALATASRAKCIDIANYDQHLGALAGCDLVIEAIAERLDWKAGLFARIAPHLGEQALIASNTSGLSVNQLAAALPVELRRRFCGVHFFNPPRYMHLVELVACRETEPGILDELETFLVTMLGKGVVRAKDTPNFIANRVGVFALLAALDHARQFGLDPDTVDALTGPAIGRPKSATCRTADIVGLDTLAHAVQTMAVALARDPWQRHYALPAWLKRLIEDGALGQKTQRGIYRRLGAEIHVYDAAADGYRLARPQIDESVVQVLAREDAGERMAGLRSLDHPQAQFLWAIFRDTFQYCAVHLDEIADSARDVDFAMRWGFGWTQGPFETWQAAGWRQVAQWIAVDIAAGRTMAATPLPAWVMEPDRDGVHSARGSWSPARRSNMARSTLGVYARQLFPDRLAGEAADYGHTIFESAAVRCWHTGDDIAILSFKTKMHTIGAEVLDGVLEAIDVAERGYAALVIWQTEPPFSAGADLKSKPAAGGKPAPARKAIGRLKRAAESALLRTARAFNVADKLMAGRLAEIERLVEKFQETTRQLKYSMVPTVAAVDGLALGGGCEFALHSDRVVATLESYIGLVEAGVGLLPAGGGCKEFVLRASREARGGDVFPFIRRYFETVATAQVSRSAEHARELGYLRAGDSVVMNRFELLGVAKAAAQALAGTGYRPPLAPRDIAVAGRPALATVKAYLVNLLEGGHISTHDHLIGSRIAEVLCGGDVDAGSIVDERWLLDLERKHFMELIATQKTQERIEHMLKTGKPLRN